jgi:hypothetical protein
MRVETVLVSSRRNFSELRCVSEVWIPAANVWVGDYPYLKRTEFIRLARRLDKVQKEKDNKRSNEEKNKPLNPKFDENKEFDKDLTY